MQRSNKKRAIIDTVLSISFLGLAILASDGVTEFSRMVSILSLFIALYLFLTIE